MVKGLVGELVVFVKRAVIRPQLSASEDRGARPDFVA